MKILEELYNYAELTTAVRPAAYWQELRDVGERRELSRNELLAELNESQKERFETFEKIFTEAGLIEDLYTFIVGFRLGVRMMAECFADDN